ncbi:MAG: GTP-binding protein [Candidatus Lokiarchaeota archaeon]|nr:GTP-binding protein [Candidatus Lokiarchaeota archaeon]
MKQKISSDALFKIIIFGDGGVGKTTLVKRFLTGIFDTSTTMTIGVDFYVKKLNMYRKKISLQIWDFAGEDRFRFLLPSYVTGASGGIFMYDITRYSSLKNFDDWLNIFRDGYRMKQTGSTLPVLMVGGKLDLEYKRSVTREKARKVVRSQNLYDYIECSSKTGRNVEKIFEEMAQLLMRRAGLVTHETKNI